MQNRAFTEYTHAELMAADFPNNEERGYRRGYIDGYQDAIDALLDMQTKGRRSPRAAYNILDKFANTRLAWWARNKKCDSMESPPDCPIQHKAGSMDKAKRYQVYLRDGGICQICGQPVNPDNWQIDHIVPLARGGADDESNWQLAHPKCNRQKWAK